MNRDEIVNELFSMRDYKYADMQKKIIPTLDASRIIGVRTPDLRAFAKKLSGSEDVNGFLNALPHEYFDEDQLHAFVISLEKDFDKCISEVEEFLPFVDNWATCDQLSPKVFKRNKEKLLPYIRKWIVSDETYTVRFAIGMLMQHYLDDSFREEYADMVASVRSEEYYINMMIAWYFATALAKQYDRVIPYLEEKRLDDWTHNKTIRKCLESYRIPPEQKQYLKTLKAVQKKENRDAQIRRISGYEKRMNEAEELIDSGQKGERLSGLIAELDAYYRSPQWKKDYADDEAGLLPGDLDRGVLSEDGLYDLIDRYNELVKL